jgi:hypothetical protein
MKIRQTLLACATVMALTTSPVWADRDNHNRGDKVDTGDQDDKVGDGHFKAPEIDAASGTSAIALLAGFLFLMSERKSRSKRPEDDE